MLEIIGIGTALTSLAVWIGWQVQQYSRSSDFLAQIREQQPLYSDAIWQWTQYKVNTAGTDAGTWQKAVLVVMGDGIRLYDLKHFELLLFVDAANLQGFWRPEKYSVGKNEIWLHNQHKEQWTILKMRLHYAPMQALVRALKEITTPEQRKAYRRQRPYIHSPLTLAYAAQQTLQGAWEIGAAFQLYIMPLNLVIFQANRVLEVLPLTAIQAIATLQRLEGGKPEGLLRFTVGDRALAFALDDYVNFGELLAAATKRSLEEPIQRKQKAKDEALLDDDD